MAVNITGVIGEAGGFNFFGVPGRSCPGRVAQERTPQLTPSEPLNSPTSNTKPIGAAENRLQHESFMCTTQAGLEFTPSSCYHRH
jgi:hypothetical protein